MYLAYTGSDSESVSSSSGYWGILTFLLLLGALGFVAVRYLGRSACFSYAQVPQLDDDVGLQLAPYEIRFSREDSVCKM